MAYGVDSGAVMASSVFVTIRILRPKWSGPKVVILSGVYCTGITLWSLAFTERTKFFSRTHHIHIGKFKATNKS